MPDMIDLPDVDALMDGGLGSWLNGQQAARAETQTKIRKITVVTVLAAAAVALVAVMAVRFELGVFLGGLVTIVGFGWIAKIRQKMVDSLKQEMNGALAHSLGIEYQVAPVSGSEFELAYEYDLLPPYDDSYFQDAWSGVVGETNFLLYEAKLTETRGSGKDRRTVTVFQGIVLRMRFARNFLGTTLIRREGFKFTLFGDDKTYNGQKLERIKMVDPRFEGAFDVYGSDQVEARYLVHPAYCERLLELERDFFGEQLCALFNGGDLLVTIRTQDLFESATLDPAQDRQLLGQTIDQFASITRLIQTLNERPRG
jgi:Protein of unknown function (DUF3137)